MADLSATGAGPGTRVRDHATWLWGVAYAAVVAGSASLGGSATLAIYALSFWHYGLYWLAYRYGAVPLPVIKRDAVTMKTFSLLALAAAYFPAPLDLLSLAVVAAGFLLNILAAAALGSDRTYYGHEVAGLPHRRITAFPYSVVAHPMLVGNIAAFGGTLLNADFREHWLPLACAHVAMNLGLLVMEVAVQPLRRGTRPTEVRNPDRRPPSRSLAEGLGLGAVGAALAAGGSAWGEWSTPPLPAAVVGACAFIYAYVLYRSYSSPPARSGERPDNLAETYP